MRGNDESGDTAVRERRLLLTMLRRARLPRRCGNRDVTRLPVTLSRSRGSVRVPQKGMPARSPACGTLHAQAACHVQLLSARVCARGAARYVFPAPARVRRAPSTN